MATIKLYGASDDLVEVEAASKPPVPGCDEYGVGNDDASFVRLSTGDVFRIEYTDRGVWKIGQHVVTGKVAVKLDLAPEGDDPDPYTDKATVTGDIEWVDVWGSWPPTDDDVMGKVNDRLNDVDHREGMDLYRRLYAALFERPAPDSVEG